MFFGGVLVNWTEVRIFTTSEGTDVVCASLIGLNITGFVIEDPKDFEEFLNDKTAKWDYIDDSLDKLRQGDTSVKAYIPENEQGAELLSLIRDELSALKSRDKENAFGSLEVSLSNVNEADWQNNWKQYFKPLYIGDNMVIKPSWENLPEGESRIVIELDPESSFGTGQHATTQLCLENIEKNLKPGDRVLDLGCGSGILSIACALIGAESVTAVDIDDNSVKIAGKNLSKNGVPSDKFTLFCGNVIDDDELVDKIGTGYDFVCANIVSDILSAMSGKFGIFLKNGGTLVTSGIITERKEEICGIIESQGFSIENYKEKEGWVSAVFHKSEK